MALELGQHVVGLGAPQQLRAGGAGPVPQRRSCRNPRSASTASPGRDRQDARASVCSPLSRPEGDVDQRVRAALGHPDQPHLRERPAPPPRPDPGRPNALGVGGRVGTSRQVPSMLSSRHGGRTRPLSAACPAAPRPPNNAASGSGPSRERALNNAALVGTDHAAATPTPTTDPRPGCASPPRRTPARTTPTPARSTRPPGRATAVTLLRPPRLGHHPVHQFRGEHPGQHADRDVIGQPLIRLRLHPPGPRHAPDVHHHGL